MNPPTPIPNITAVASIARALVVLFAATFVGAMVLPLASDGSLPTDWAHWRPVLGTATGAAVAAELLWIRTHLSAYAAVLGLGTQTATPSPGAIAAAVKPLSVLALLSVMLALIGCGATQAQVVSDLNIGLSAAQCGLDTYSADISAGESEGAAVADATTKCGLTAAQESGLLAAHRKAEVAEGYVLKPATDAGR